MKLNILLFFISMSLISFGQNKKYLLHPITNYDSIYYELNNLNKNKIYEINNDELINLTQRANKKYTFVYMFAWWCEPCVKDLPKYLELRDKFPEDQLLIITPEKNNSQGTYLTHLYNQNKFNINFPTFNISDVPVRAMWKKYNNFLKNIFLDAEDLPMGVFFILNNNGEVIFSDHNSKTAEEKKNLFNIFFYKFDEM